MIKEVWVKNGANQTFDSIRIDDDYTVWDYIGECECNDIDVSDFIDEDGSHNITFEVNIDAEITLNLVEARELAENLDWGNPYEDPEDIKDSLKTNWEYPMDDSSVEMVYEEMCRIWDEKEAE